MKSSTRHNFAHLIKDELVKRFEQVVKDEIHQHNIAVEKTNRDISDLKASFQEHTNLLNHWKERAHQDYQEILSEFQKSKEELSLNHKRQDKYLAEKGHELDKLQKTFDKEKLQYISSETFDSFKNEVLNELKLVKQVIEKERNLQKDAIYEIYSKHRDELQKELKDIKNMLFSFRDTLFKFEEKLNINIVDATGISRMIKIDQKGMFIMEKKIENLYEGIRRLRDRIDV